jgi:hypothetical protein
MEDETHLAEPLERCRRLAEEEPPKLGVVAGLVLPGPEQTGVELVVVRVVVDAGPLLEVGPAGVNDPMARPVDPPSRGIFSRGSPAPRARLR